MDIDGTNQRRVPGVPTSVTFASWSPDGHRIVFTTSSPPPNLSADIHVIEPDGSGHLRLTHGEGISEYPCWSPDGNRIAFQTSRDGNFAIYLVNADGTGHRRLTNNQVLDGRPSWR
jgi:TolB protein